MRSAAEDPEVLLADLSEVLRMVRELNRDLDAGYRMHVGKHPWQTEKGPRMTLKSTRERLRHIELRAGRVFESHGQAVKTLNEDAGRIDTTHPAFIAGYMAGDDPGSATAPRAGDR